MRYTDMFKAIIKAFLPVAAVFLLLFAAYGEAEARAGRGGGSFGYRGSRTYSAPVKQAPPRQQQATKPQGAQAPAQAQQMAPRSGLFGGLAAGLAGGVIGSLLFSSLGNAAVGPGAGGIGMLDILLIGGAIFLVMRFFRRRPQQNDFLGGRQAAGGVRSGDPDGLDAGLGDIRRMDAVFDEEHFMAEAIDIFFTVQAAWVRGDADRLSPVVAPQALETLRAEMDRIRSRGLFNRVEGLAIKDTAITEAWQERGTDCITLKITASAVDCLVNASGETVEGSSSEAIQFTEYWTFAREIGKDWRLSAIQQPS